MKLNIKEKYFEWVIMIIIAAFTVFVLFSVLSCSVTENLKRDIHRSEILYTEIKYLRVDSVSEKKFSTEYYLTYPLWPDVYLRLERYGFGDHQLGDTIKLSPVEKGDLTFKKK
jgi:hypothetical protein